MTEKPVSDVNVRRGDAGMPGVAPADGSGEPPVPAPPVRVPSSVRIPPRPSAPPTSAMPVVAAHAAPSPAPGSAIPGSTEPGSPASDSATPEPEAPASRRTTARAANRATPSAASGVESSGKAARKSVPGAEQIQKQLAARTAQLKVQLKAAQPGLRARALGSTVMAGAQRLGLAKVAAALSVVVVLVLLIWWLTSMGAAKQESAESSRTPAAGTSSAPAARDPLPLEGVSPLDFRLGDCFKDFDANAVISTVVACDSGHSAQLVAIESYAASDVYPGRDPLKQRALDACKAATLTEKSSGYVLNYKLAYPSSSSWGTGDRRVDCYVAADAGNVINESLLP